jgi:hypothetical protein
MNYFRRLTPSKIPAIEINITDAGSGTTANAT